MRVIKDHLFTTKGTKK